MVTGAWRHAGDAAAPRRRATRAACGGARRRGALGVRRADRRGAGLGAAALPGVAGGLRSRGSGAAATGAAAAGRRLVAVVGHAYRFFSATIARALARAARARRSSEEQGAGCGRGAAEMQREVLGALRRAAQYLWRRGAQGLLWAPSTCKNSAAAQWQVCYYAR